MAKTSFTQLSNRELLDRTLHASANQRTAVVLLIELLAEIDVRRLYLGEGFSSLFTYCTHVLRFSADEAYHRIAAARAAQEFPVILDRLRDGSLTLTSATTLAPHLTRDNAETLIANASGKSKREVEHQMASLAPKPDAKSVVRRLPEPAALAAAPTIVDAPAERANSAPLEPIPIVPPPSPRSFTASLSSDRYLLRVTLSAEAHAKLRRAQDLMRHIDPKADPAVIVDRALTLLVEDLERQKLASVKNPRPATSPGNSTDRPKRHIPAAVRRQVWKRDGGRCAFVGNRGRCQETGQLEFHHVEPFALGGPTTVGNLELRCRAHNQYEGTLWFGADDSGTSQASNSRSANR